MLSYGQSLGNILTAAIIWLHRLAGKLPASVLQINIVLPCSILMQNWSIFESSLLCLN